MKSILFSFALMVSTVVAVMAQVPQSIKYQAVARNSSGTEIASSPVSVRFSILDGSATGPVVYQETHNLTTNQFGLFTASLGLGFVSQGTFAQVNWGSGTKFLKIEIDEAGGSNYTDMGTSQLVSVPYSLYANAANTANTVINVPSLSINGNTLTIDGGNSVTLPSGGGGGTYTAGSGIAINGNVISNTAQGTTYTAGSGISINGTTIANTAPNQTVTLAGGGITAVTGSYPSFTVTTPAQTLSLNGSSLSLSNGGGSVTLPSGGGGTLNDAYNFGGSGAGRIVTANSGAVEVNTSTASQAAFRASHSGNGASIVAANSSSSTTFPTIQATTASTLNTVAAITGSTSGSAYAVAGQVEASATAFAAVYGSNLRTTGGPGVFGQGFNGSAGEANNTAGFGVFGENIRAANGVRPNNPAAGMGSIGYVGALAQTQNNGGVGLLGINVAPDRTGATFDNAGVEGQGFVGLLGLTNTGALGYGVLSSGDIGGTQNLFVLGDLQAGGMKNFVIDYPFDPANKYLKHFSIESNEVLNMYRGTIQLNVNGEATVTLPNYFEAVNTNFSYQLTAIGSAAPAIFVKSEIANNTFVIAGGQPNQKISWQVTAERNDKYAAAHPENKLDVINKPAHLVGKYVHPVEYGKTMKDAVISVNASIQKGVIKPENNATVQQKMNTQQ
jgi:hypothetical protein